MVLHMGMGGLNGPEEIEYQNFKLVETNIWIGAYTLMVSTTGGGTTNPAPGTLTYNAGNNVTVNAIPNIGYEFDHWTLDGINVGATNPCTVTLNTNQALNAVFTPVSWWLWVIVIPVTVFVVAIAVLMLQRRKRQATTPSQEPLSSTTTIFYAKFS